MTDSVEENSKLADSTKKMHLMLGGLGLGMPLMLYFGNLFVFGISSLPKAISNYYYEPVGGLFIGIAFSMGVFLVSFEGFEKNVFKSISIIAGIASMAFGLFPVTPTGSDGRTTAGVIHIASAFVFYFLLSILAFFAFKETVDYSNDSNLTDAQKQKQEKMQDVRNKIYPVSGVLMFFVLISIALIEFGIFIPPIPSPTFWLEYAANLIFGLAWLVKGHGVFFLNGDNIWDNWEKMGLIIFFLLILGNIGMGISIIIYGL